MWPVVGGGIEVPRADAVLADWLLGRLTLSISRHQIAENSKHDTAAEYHAERRGNTGR